MDFINDQFRALICILRTFLWNVLHTAIILIAMQYFKALGSRVNEHRGQLVEEQEFPTRVSEVGFKISKKQNKSAIFQPLAIKKVIKDVQKSYG